MTFITNSKKCRLGIPAQLKKIYFRNGGYLTFDDCDSENSEVNANGHEFGCFANNDDTNWSFRYYGETINKK